MSSAQTGWEEGWSGHESAQRRRLAALPFVEKLAWLDEAHRFVLAAARRRASLVSDGRTPRP